ncbi:MAG: enoyl-CoA hydratase [Pelagibacterium sp. SCN 64-44]|nr:MAG: enoyl-CoA hydratase [Pelagibacterium sp. SCN 64-44]
MTEAELTFEVTGAVGRITFNRPQAHNAMTWGMYEALGRACDTMAADPAIRCAVLRGTGGKAFVAGTDITQFTRFSGAEDGLGYEAAMEPILARLEALPVPTIAVIEGWAVGGGLALASLCDIRIATPDARFGLPIARTLGNCLSLRNVARLAGVLGPSRFKRLVMLAEMLTADELAQSGYLAAVVEREALDAKVEEVIAELCAHAPLTMRATKQAMVRLNDLTPPDDDLVSLCYGSADFKEGVRAYLEKRPPEWRGA